MKLKGITKLVLAGTALAATAATLTTSTYAWYVTNAKVDATGVQGQVASTSTGSLFISKNSIVNSVNKPSDYVTKITLEKVGTTDPEADEAAGKYTFADLNPQTKAVASSDSKYYFKSSDASAVTTPTPKTYYKESGENPGTYVSFASPTADDFKAGTVYEQSATQIWVDQDGYKIDTPKLVTFKYWLKADKGGTASIKLSIDNTSTAVTSQIALSTSGLPTAVTAAGQSITADAIYALRMDVTQQNGIEGEEGTTTAATANYQLDKIAKDMTGNASYSSATSTAKVTNSVAFTDLTGGDANEYYRAILGRSGYNTNATSGVSTDGNTGSDTWASVTLAAGVDTLLTFNIWLEGSDAECWDSCRGQSFKLSFNFELAA